MDTKYFSEEFKNKLLAEFDDLDKETGGLMIKSDNFQALEILKMKYNNSIGYCYIDPPYNTASSEILYKNGYKDSTWNTMIINRLQSAFSLLKTGCIQTVAIDNEELYNLGRILDAVYGKENRIAVVTVQHNPKGRNQAVFFSENVEYMLEYTNDIQNAKFNEIAITDTVIATFTEEDEIGKYRWENFVRARNNRKKEDRPDN